MDLLALSHDIHSIIWSNLDLQDVLHLRQTCSALSSAISEDKQLWRRIFDKDVKHQSLCSPLNLCDAGDANAHDIESWVKHSILLDHTYKTHNRILSVRRLQIPKRLHVTWLKIILGRWCLVAAADDRTSELSLWEIEEEGILLTGKAFLEAPVIDGQIDVTVSGICCAITVGAMNACILILAIYQTGESVNFKQLRRIVDGSLVRYFHGDLVGFAVRGGDDTYPYLENWKTGQSYLLRFPHVVTAEVPCRLPIDPCKAMTVRHGLTFTLHRSAIHAFIAPCATHDECNAVLKHLATLYLPEPPACYGEFLPDDAAEPHFSAMTKEIRAIYQDRDSFLCQVSISWDVEIGEPFRFLLTEMYMKSPPGVSHKNCLHTYDVGSSGKMIFFATSVRQREWWNPSLLVASFSALEIPDIDKMEKALDDNDDHIQISKQGLPLSHLLSCVDFDDGNGLLLMGTISGDVRLASFLMKCIVTCKSVESNPVACPEADVSLQETSQVPVALDLPLFYNIPKNYQFGDNLPLEIKERIASQWQDPRFGVVTLSGWSNDWWKFECIWDWIIPLSRWGPLDPDLIDLPSADVVRDRLQALGEMIPVLYSEDNHHQVVFRIGQRMFHSRMKRPNGGMGEEDDFEMHPYGILGVLPVIYDEFVGDPTSILPSLSDFDIQRNLEHMHCPDSLIHRITIAACVYDIRNYMNRALNVPSEDTVMAKWTDEEWDKIFYCTRESS